MARKQHNSWLFLAGVLVAYATCNTSVAGAYELKKTRIGEQVRWPTSVVTLYVDAKLEQALGAKDVRAALTMATDAWRGLPGVPDLVIGEGPASGFSADKRSNGIYLVNEWPYEDDQLAMTVSTYDVTGKVLGVDVLINAQHRFALLPDGENDSAVDVHDLGALLTHEFGHVLGLDESMAGPDATMWGYLNEGEVHQRSISKDDEDGVVAAYAGGNPWASAGCGQASVVGTVRTRSPLQLGCLLVLSVVALLRRRLPSKRRS